MSLHAFADESIRNGYLIPAAVIATASPAAARGKLRELRKPGQRRLRMKDENDSRRRNILSTPAGLEVQIHLYRAPVAGRPIRADRDACPRVLIPALLELDVERLVIDLCSQDHRDVQVVHETLTKLDQIKDLPRLAEWSGDRLQDDSEG
ncbi:MAG: hypothetical protein QOE84_2750 [Actinomycetota bacterium]|nr:hypothetical protein [Actinomycetota bacterium]